MKSGRYHLELGGTSACTKRLMEGTKLLGQRAVKVSTRGCFLFGSWLLSKKAAGVAASVGVDFIGLVKTNTKRFCETVIEVLTTNWPGGPYIVLRIKHMVLG